jgi:hypothetical protein
MTATIISNVPPFGALTNRTIASLHSVNESLTRLQHAVATAESGYEGEDGTQFEGVGTNFGVSPGDTPGAKGKDYGYAIGVLAEHWATFWKAALPAIQSIDNGVRTTGI